MVVNGVVQDNKCISPQMHAGSGHVSEMGQFALIYGLHAYHYHSFAVGHIPSYAFKVLKQNGAWHFLSIVVLSVGP